MTKPDEMGWEEYARYLEQRLADAQHTSKVLLGAIEAVCCGAQTLEALRQWHEGGPRSKGDGLYSWRDERRDLLERLERAERPTP